MGTLYTLNNAHVARYNPRTKFFDRLKIGNGNSYFYDFAQYLDTLFVSDCKNSLIYSYDTRNDSNDAIKTVRAPTLLRVGRSVPMLFAISEISQFLALVNYKSIFVIEPGGHKVVATLPSGRSPVALAASPDCRALYTVDRAKDSEASILYKIDVNAKKVVGSLALNGITGGIEVSPDGQTLYISLPNEDRIAVVGANSLSAEASIPVRDTTGSLSPAEIAISPDGKKLYATTASNRIAVVDLAARSPLPQIETKFSPRTMAIDPADNMLYVACYLVDILVIDMETDRIVRRMTVGQDDIKKIAVGRL